MEISARIRDRKNQQNLMSSKSTATSGKYHCEPCGLSTHQAHM